MKVVDHLSEANANVLTSANASNRKKFVWNLEFSNIQYTASAGSYLVSISVHFGYMVKTFAILIAQW